MAQFLVIGAGLMVYKYRDAIFGAVEGWFSGPVPDPSQPPDPVPPQPPLQVPEELMTANPDDVEAEVRRALVMRQERRNAALESVFLAIDERRKSNGEGGSSPTGGPSNRTPEQEAERQLHIMIETFATLVGEREQELRVSTEDIESCFCSLTQSIMIDPVHTADGLVYEREAITRWLRDHDTSPLTNLPLEHKCLTPDLNRRKLIDRVVAAVNSVDG